jgi:hypothetical protein
MRELTIRIHLNEPPNDWSLEINGQRYEHIPTDVLEELVNVAVIEMESSCLNEQTIQ